jgi:Spy/CpxP family protein refolding chaperone
VVNKGLVIALALSLGANVFLGGYVAGKFAGGDHARERHDRGLHGPRGDFEDLTPAARAALRRAFKEHRAESGDDMAASRALHDEFIAVLTAETFDRAAADAIAARFAALDISFRGDMARIMIEAADELSLEDRKALARHLEKRKRRVRGGPPEGGPPLDGPPTD